MRFVESVMTLSRSELLYRLGGEAFDFFYQRFTDYSGALVEEGGNYAVFNAAILNRYEEKP